MTTRQVKLIENYIRGIVRKTLNENNNFKISDFSVDDILEFNDDEQWVVVKTGLRPQNSRKKSDEITIKPYNQLAKSQNTTVPIDIDLDYLNKNIRKIIKN